MNDRDEPRGGLIGMIQGGWKQAKDKLTEKGVDLSLSAASKIANSEQGQKFGSAIIREGILNTVDDIKDKGNSIVQESKNKLNPDNKSSYQLIRESLGASNDGLLKTIFKNIIGRVIDVGTGIAGFVGATFVNTIFKPIEAEKLHTKDVHNIFASFMSKALGGFKKAPVTA